MHERLLYTGNVKTRLIYASVSSVEKNFKPISHSHPNTEIIYVSSGEGYIYTFNDKIKLYKGDLVVITGGAEHREENTINKDFTFYAVGLNDFGIENSQTGIRVFTPNEVDGAILSKTFKGVFDELKRNDEFWQNAVNLYVEVICTLSSRYTGAKNGVNEQRGTSLVESVKRYIDGRFYTAIKSEDMANALSVSYSTLIHTFKAETGKTITEYKLSKQIEEAKSLLSLTDMSINQIALNVGFGTNTYFSKTFRRETGYTPKKYREKFKN